MRIKSITISGLRSFGPEPVTLELGPRTVLIGPHGAGKSTVIMALRLLSQSALRPSGQIAVWYNCQPVIEKGRDVHLAATLAGNDAGIESVYEFVISERDSPNPYLVKESITKRTRNETAVHDICSHDKSQRDRARGDSSISAELKALIHVSKYDVSQSPIEAIVVNDGDDRLLALVDYEFHQVHSYVEFCRVPMAGYFYPGVKYADGSSRRIEDLGTGLRNYLHVATFLSKAFMSSRNDVLLIEEPDAGLHPDMIHRLADLIKRASDFSQIIMTTNNPGMLSEFSETPEDVVVVERPFDYTELKRLERAPLEHWLKDYGLGHAWESGAVGGRMDAHG